MGFDGVAWGVGGGAMHTPELYRLAAYILGNQNYGIVGPDDLKVAQLGTPGAGVQVAPGAAIIPCRTAGYTYQSYLGRCPTPALPGVTAQPAGSARRDLIVAQVRDPWLPTEPWPDPPSAADGPYVDAYVLENVGASVIGTGANLPGLRLSAEAYLTAQNISAVLLAGAIGVYAYDASRDDLIADGVTAGGVRIGGMRAAEARVAIEDQLARPLRKRIVVTHGKQRFRLTAAKARLRVNTERMVQEALAKSREGNVVSRTLRELTGENPDEAELPARLTYSERAVDRLVKRRRGEVNQPARGRQRHLLRLEPRHRRGPGGHRGQDRQAAARHPGRARAARGGPRRGGVDAEVTQPEVTREELASKYPLVLTVDRPNFKLNLWRNLQLVKSYTVAIGAIGYDTPSGLYNIQNKAVNPAWTMPNSDWVAPADRGKVVPGGTAANPLKARWLGIYNGAGIHGTDATYSLGSAASHGCIRMAIPDVIELYDQVPVGAPVYIS